MTVDDGAGRLQRLLGRGLEMNALALMATSGITALFGVIFWAVAVRYPAAEVGRASAVLSTATMLAVLSSSGAGLMFARFLGSAGPRVRSMVVVGYGVVTVVALVLGGGFVLFFAADALFPLAVERWLFSLLVVVLAWFTLQDWVLIGMRAARWVPLEQLAFSGMKLLLLVVFASTMQVDGIVLAWALPAAVGVLVIGPLLAHALGRQTQVVEGAVELPGRRALGGIFVGEYASGITAVVIPLLMPLIVVAQLGTEANAYYALPWLVSEAITVLLWNISSSYVTEASNDIGRSGALMRRAFRMSCAVGLLGTPFLLVAAPWLLSLLGGSYAAQGTDLLRVMAAALPFTIIYSTYVAAARVRQQMGRVVALQALSGATVVTLTLVLIQPMGIVAVGIAYLSMAILNTVIVAVPLWRMFRADHRLTPDTP